MPEITDAELRQFVRYQNFGTPDEVQKKINDLEKDNHSQREEIRGFKAQVEKLPPEDAVVLTGEAAKEYPKLKELGKPSEIQAKLTEAEEAKRKLAQVDRRSAAAKYAKVAGLAEESVDALIAIPAFEGATFDVKPGKVKDAKGNEVDGEVAFVTFPGDNEQPMTFDQAREKVPALKGLRTASETVEKRAGVPFVPQSGNENKKPGNVFDRIRAEREAGNKKEAAEEKAPPLTQRLGMTARV